MARKLAVHISVGQTGKKTVTSTVKVKTGNGTQPNASAKITIKADN